MFQGRREKVAMKYDRFPSRAPASPAWMKSHSEGFPRAGRRWCAGPPVAEKRCWDSNSWCAARSSSAKTACGSASRKPGGSDGLRRLPDLRSLDARIAALVAEKETHQHELSSLVDGDQARRKAVSVEREALGRSRSVLSQSHTKGARPNGRAGA
jgi:hypothetical protein